MIKLFNYIKNLFLTNNDKIDILCVKLLRLMWNKEDVYLNDLIKLNILLKNSGDQFYENLNFYLYKVKNLYEEIEKITYRQIEILSKQSTNLNLENILNDIVRNAKIGLDCSKPIN